MVGKGTYLLFFGPCGEPYLLAISSQCCYEVQQTITTTVTLLYTKLGLAATALGTRKDFLMPLLVVVLIKNGLKPESVQFLSFLRCSKSLPVGPIQRLAEGGTAETKTLLCR